MSEQSTPSPEEMLPPRLQLYMKFDRAYDRFVEEMRADKEQMDVIEDAEHMDDFDTFTNEKLLLLTLNSVYEDTGEELPFRGMPVKAVGLRRSDDGMFMFEVVNGKRDEIPDDVPQTGDTFRFGLIYAGTEFPPFVVPAWTIVEDFNSDVLEYLAAIRDRGEELDYLSDDEAKVMLALVNSAHANAEETVDMHNLDVY